MKGKKGYVPTTVAVAPLCAILDTAHIDRVDALKIDIEGYEDRALIPFINTAPRHLWPRRILIEICHSNRWATDCLQVLVNAGYDKVSSGKKDALLVRRVNAQGRSGLAPTGP
jgi:hypothetical protein